MEPLRDGELDVRVNLSNVAQWIQLAKFEIRKGNKKIAIHLLTKVEKEFDRAGLNAEAKRNE